MRKILLLCTGFYLCIQAYGGSGDTLSRCRVGLFYSYLNISQELTSYSSCNWIDGNKTDEYNWTDEEIDDLNTYVDINQIWSIIGLDFGVDIYKQKDKPFELTAQIGAGYPIFKHQEKQKSNGDVLFEGQQSGMDFIGQIGLGLKYKYKSWIFSATPLFKVLYVNSDKVEYNYLPEGGYTTGYNFKNTSFYSRLDLLAERAFNRFQVFAGPGFYIYSNTIDFDIEKYSQSQTFKDEITMEFKSTGNVDGVVGFKWDFYDRFSWGSMARVGSDFNVVTGITYKF